MNFKRAGGSIFGVNFNKKEQEAINREIQLQCAEFDEKNADEIDALVLWILHERFGFGKIRLKRFYNAFADEIKSLIDRYQVEKSDSVWLCTRKLNDYGIDIAEWNKEEKYHETQSK